MKDRPVAQFGRASVSKTEGWGFDSLLACFWTDRGVKVAVVALEVDRIGLMLTKIYKPGQGKYTRLVHRVHGCIAIVAFGCWRLYEKLDSTDLNLWVVSLVPVIVLAGFAGVDLLAAEQAGCWRIS